MEKENAISFLIHSFAVMLPAFKIVTTTGTEKHFNTFPELIREQVRL
jgi:hypothetical protein